MTHTDGSEPAHALAGTPPPASLRDAVDRYGPLAPADAAALAAELARRLARSPAGRGLHPSGVLLAEDGPRVVESGAAHPSFVSPEEARGHDVVPPSDVFALGAVLAFAATGRPPFGTGPAEDVLHRVVHDEPDLSGMPDGLAALAADCLAKDPAERPTPGDVLARIPGEAVYVRDRRWQVSTHFTAGLFVTWMFVLLPLFALPVLHGLGTSGRIAAAAAISVLGGGLFTLLGLWLPSDRLTLNRDGLAFRYVADTFVPWNLVEQVGVIGDGHEHKLVIWYAGDERPIEGDDLHGGTVVCSISDVMAEEEIVDLRAALAHFADARYVEPPDPSAEP
ncbi:hypothetical protein [Actinomadura rifamycini]|uniref:hypothetical protein n=1 Tax=Actinomadura rifamycini TaxID=31962 RepID=UPI000412637B|nr:hypothetical protein [Actinomadura rifamycini]